MNKLEELCRPLLTRICEYCVCARAGAPVDVGALRLDVDGLMADIRRTCEGDPVLQREFQRIERPLVFFIDYTIKEGGFPFSGSWQPMARGYKELSGDEKFFDLLADALDDPDSSLRLKMFYLMMGLGFDGCFKGDSEYMERRMRLCSMRTDVGAPLTRDMLSSMDPRREERPFRVRRYSCRFWMALSACGIVAVIALACNGLYFSRMTAEYRESVYRAVNAYMQGDRTPSVSVAGPAGVAGEVSR